MRIIAGQFRSRTLVAPRGDKTRPTTDRAREALFNVLSNTIDLVDASVLDLFTGSGALAFEAISRGAAQATLVEDNRYALQAAKENASLLHVDEVVDIVAKDVYKYLQHATTEPFDIIFADPPYNDPRTQYELPALLFDGGWLAAKGVCIIEHRAGESALAPVGSVILRELNAGEAGFTILTYATRVDTTETISV